jgi:hypothetical protein
MNAELLICCPNCGRKFDLNRAMTEQARKLFLADARHEVDQERSKVREQLTQELLNEQALKDRERDSLIADLRASIEILRQKANQGSQQQQGEALETVLFESLKCAFPNDTIARVGKGKNGGDILHTVHDGGGQECGRILWEAKNTRTFSARWLSKLREDAQHCGAHISILLTKALPKEIENFGVTDGTWVTNFACHLGLASALRGQIIASAPLSRELLESSSVATLHAYVLGPEFRRRVEVIITSIEAAKAQVEREQQFFQRVWSERQKLLTNISANVSGFCGDIAGITASPQRNGPDANTTLAQDTGVMVEQEA